MNDAPHPALLPAGLYDLLPPEAEIEAAVTGAIRSGARTRDIAGSGARDWLGTTAFTDVVLKNLRAA